MRISEIISQTRLSRLDAEVFLVEILGSSKTELFAHPNRELSARDLAKFREYEKKRAAGKSVAAIIGKKEFFGLEFFVDGNVLIPRPETELLVEEILALEPESLLDVGTGSGAIAIAMKKNLPTCRVAASDISAKALKVARKNAAGIGVEVEFIESDLLEKIPPDPPLQKGREKGFEIIAANLPYIPENSTEIQKSVADFEPEQALFAGPDGLDVIRQLLTQVSKLPQKPKFVLLEFGGGEQVENLEKFTKELFPHSKLTLISDLANIPRVLKLEI